MIGFTERITYSADWSDNGKEWSQLEGFLQESDLTQYLQSMSWRIIAHKREKVSE